jgi:hypothetical protein
LPLDEYSFDSPLIGVRKNARGYEGWYAPSKAGEWRIRVRLTDEEARRLGRKMGFVQVVRGKSEPGKPLRWSIRQA